MFVAVVLGVTDCSCRRRRFVVVVFFSLLLFWFLVCVVLGFLKKLFCCKDLCFVSAFKNHNVQFVWLVYCSVFSRPNLRINTQVPELRRMLSSWRLCNPTSHSYCVVETCM